MSALEIELTFAELGPHQRLVSHPFRSRKPQGVVQEFYGLVLAHYAIRSVMIQAAQTKQLDPDRISFSRAARLLPVSILLGDLLDGSQQEIVWTELATLLCQELLPPRRPRRVPRTRKRPWAKHRLRHRGRAYQITPLPPFRSRVTIHAPPLAA